MNPIFQAVIYGVVSSLNSRCRACGGRVEAVTSGRHVRRKCVRWGADAPRPARVSAPRRARREGDTAAKGLFRWSSLWRGRAR